jgi:hypothetical protein
LLDVPLRQAAENVVPVSATAGESVDRLRRWAAGRCLDAERGGLYGRSGQIDGAANPASSASPANPASPASQEPSQPSRRKLRRAEPVRTRS